MERTVASQITLIASFLLIAFIPIASSFAQIQTGRIVGAVLDPNKAVVPNAKVVITNTATNQSQSLATNSVGEFVLTPVNPGLYSVTVTAQGFGPAEVKGVEVLVGQSARVDVELKVGDVATKIDVTAAAALLRARSYG